MILIAEDNSVVASYLKAHLKIKGYETILAEDGYQAWLELEKRSRLITLLISDIAMPNLSGISLVEKMRAEPEMKDIPVIFASGIANTEIVAKAGQLGKIHFLVKPLTMEVLLPKIRELIPLSVLVLRDKERVKKEFQFDDAQYKKIATDFLAQVNEAKQSLSAGLRDYTIFNELHGLKLLREGAELLGAIRFTEMLDSFEKAKEIDIAKAMQELKDLASELNKVA
jgi:DNA-binding response OmpR family regulator